jgi:ATP-dependent RNA helicase DDX5/DBP2
VLRTYFRFTATWPREVQKIAGDFIKNPVEIKFGDGNNLTANNAITQIVRVVKESDKTEELKKVLQLINPSGMPDEQPKTIIFVSRKKECDNLGNQMWNAGFLVDSLHGDKEQHQRTKVMEAFKKSQTRVLVATDIAARGLDVKDVEVVINFDFPGAANGIEDYVHRIGRTGRADAEGRAFTFFTAENAKSANQLINVLEGANQAVPEELRRLDRGVEMAPVVKSSWGSSGDSGGRGRGGGDSGGRGRGSGDSGGRGRGSGDSGGRGRGGNRDSGGRGRGSGDSGGRGRGKGIGDSGGRGRGSGDSGGRGRGRGSGGRGQSKDR